LEPDIEALLRNRPTMEDSDSVIANAVPEWLRPLIWVLVVISATGLVLSLWIHIGAIMGRLAPPFFWVLHVGIFVVWFPAVLVAQRLVGSSSRKDFWKVILRGTPDWMRYMLYGFFAYDLFLFFRNLPGSGTSSQSPAEQWRVFSGVWMGFYSGALAILYSAANSIKSSPRCTNGHLAMPNAAYCTQCGQPVMRGR
jgi:hypothetical protein